VQGASRVAEAIAVKAARLAAAAGLDYTPPEGLGFEMPPVDKVGSGYTQLAGRPGVRVWRLGCGVCTPILQPWVCTTWQRRFCFRRWQACWGDLLVGTEFCWLADVWIHRP
jgi:hypothetical protein